MSLTFERKRENCFGLLLMIKLCQLKSLLRILKEIYCELTEVRVQGDDFGELSRHSR